MERADRADPGHPRDRPQGLPGRDAGEARARRTSSSRRTSPAHEAGVGRLRSGPLVPGRTYFPEPTDEAIAHAARLINESERPIVLAGNGVLRRRAAPALRALAQGLHVPVAATFMGKGARRRPLAPVADGGRASRRATTSSTGFDRADLVICGRLRPRRVRAVALEPGRDEADRPHRHAARRGRRGLPAGGRARRRHPRRAGAAARRRRCRAGSAARARASATSRARRSSTPTCGPRCSRDLTACVTDAGYPIKPQRALYELRRALGPGGHRRQRRRRPQDLGRAAVPGVRAEHGRHLERLRGDGHRAARARSRRSSSIRIGRSSRCAATAAS